MLNRIEISDIKEYVGKIEDKNIKELLEQMIFEYSEYRDVGTIKEVSDLKEYADMKPSDYIRIINNVKKLYKDELDAQKKGFEYEILNLKNKKNK